SAPMWQEPSKGPSRKGRRGRGYLRQSKERGSACVIAGSFRRDAQSSSTQVAGGPPLHSRPGQHCSFDVQVSPSVVHSAARALGINATASARTNLGNWL